MLFKSLIRIPIFRSRIFPTHIMGRHFKNLVLFPILPLFIEQRDIISVFTEFISIINRSAIRERTSGIDRTSMVVIESITGNNDPLL